MGSRKSEESTTARRAAVKKTGAGETERTPYMMNESDVVDSSVHSNFDKRDYDTAMKLIEISRFNIDDDQVKKIGGDAQAQDYRLLEKKGSCRNSISRRNSKTSKPP
ncbi:hypothetical protein M569_09522 [Genlisea aurea]|uniref:Uncharacterized protein n=1 Tax=Genlisea aurea TaxID=192259 RepID=S8DQ70_9LAMI|nr:hypothetical protein M569_09522 [Genlisea aurea]